ncbi:uncharacterized protein LOC115666963 [Syzygium oleosum]|uniref:uncharacterized protein LOC115666963 n=1 Tax=Syzygium oleosum TaxID=219896 RepID=UPI0024B9DDBF|nr:uncharacterized protein LOC115666963 [Syzygium oleosum]
MGPPTNHTDSRAIFLLKWLMESFNNSNNKKQRISSLGMPPLSSTSQRMEGQSSQNPNINPKKRKRTLASRQYSEIFHPEEISQIMQMERIVKSLEANIGKDFVTMYYWERQYYLFQVENDKLKRKITEYVQLKKEKDELTEVYVEQQRKYEELMNQLGLPTYNYM